MINRRLQRSERNLFHGVFDDAGTKLSPGGALAGGTYGVEWDTPNGVDHGGASGIRRTSRGSVRPDHAVARRYGHGNTGGYTTRDFGDPDQYVGPAHFNAPKNRRIWPQEYVRPSPGAGFSGGKDVRASTSRVRRGSAHEFLPIERSYMGYPAGRREPF